MKLRYAFLIVLLTLSSPGSADCDRDPECDDPSAWSRFTHVRLKVSSTVEQSVEWDARFDHETLDALVEVSANQPGYDGLVALVGGSVMLSKDMQLRPGYEIDALDAPMLSIKLLAILLSRSFSEGPEAITATQTINYKDTTGIKYATPSASGYIPASWKITGEINKRSEEDFTFDFVLVIPMTDTEDQSVSMSGTLGMFESPILPDSQSLDGWTTYGLGPMTTKTDEVTILDYGAKPDSESQYKTIGDIRSFIARENDPGFKDTEKNFTGFWKKDCAQAFGLSINPDGTDGKYSVVFCGPGGCGDPAQGRPTFINGDQHYEVVSESELVQIYRSGERTSYIRCTTDPHPILKYAD